MSAGRSRRSRPVRVIPFLVLILAVPVASAQATLLGGTPGPNAHADAGTSYVEVRFRERIDPAYTAVDVVGVTSLASLADGPVRFDPEAPDVARRPVTPLEDGYYFV